MAFVSRLERFKANMYKDRRKTVIEDVLAANGGKAVIAKSTACKILGVGDRKMTRLLRGVPYVVSGRNHAHMYAVGDVVDAYLKQ